MWKNGKNLLDYWKTIHSHKIKCWFWILCCISSYHWDMIQIFILQIITMPSAPILCGDSNGTMNLTNNPVFNAKNQAHQKWFSFEKLTHKDLADLLSTKGSYSWYLLPTNCSISNILYVTSSQYMVDCFSRGRHDKVKAKVIRTTKPLKSFVTQQYT